MKKPLLLLALAGISIGAMAQSGQMVGSADPALRLPTRPLQLSNGNNERSGDPANSVQAVFPNFGWNNKAPLPAARWGTGPVFSNPCIAAANPGYVYLIGGADASFANTPLNTRYDVQAGTYTAMAPIPQARLQICPVEVNGKIYVIGGYAGSFAPVTTNSIYDIATNTWTTGAPLPQATGDAAIAVYKDSLIYVADGYSGSADLNLVQVYNTFTNTWTSATPTIGPAVGGCRMGIVGNEIVFCGGYSQTLAATQSSAILGTINPASPTSITWTALPSYPGGTTGRHASGVPLESNGLVYFCGGDPTGAGTSALNSCYAYNTITDAWDSGPNMPVGVSNICNLAGAVRNDSLFMVTMAGYNGTAVTTSHSWLGIGTTTPPSAGLDATICTGSSVQITASNSLSYSWSPSGTLNNATISNPVASPTTTTTYTVTMNRGWGCPVTDQVVVTVNALPIVAVNGDSSFCAGDTAFLNASSGGTSQWYFNGQPIAGANTPFYAATAPGVYNMTKTNLNGCTDSAAAGITVVLNALPAVNASSTASAVCNGSPVTLTGSGATSYSWTGGVTDGVPFNPTATDTYTVTGTDANGCSDTATATVNINALPTVTANATATSVCDGTPVTLTGGGATSYTWTASVTDNVPFTPTVTDTYTVTGTDANGCSNTDMITVTVNANPAVTVALGQDTACTSAGSITLNGESPAGGTWSGPGVTGNSFDPVAAGMGNIMINYMFTDANGCSGSATDSIWVDICNGITVPVAGDVNIFPNPVNDVLSIELASAPSAVMTVEITNALGQVVRTFTMAGTSQQVDMSSMNTGVYFVRMMSGDSISVYRIVKK